MELERIRFSAPPSLLVFVHVPKTGGKTLNLMLSRCYLPDQVYEIMMRGMSLRLQQRKFIPDSLLSLSKLSDLKLALREPRRIALLHGHLDLSIGRFLPKDAEYITLLRNPVQRAVSHYHHYRRQTGDPVQELAMRSTLTEWVSDCGLVEMDNGQTRRLAGEMRLPIGGVTRETLEKAKSNLAEKFSVVGVTERFEEFQILVHRRLGRPYERYPMQNLGNAGRAWAAPDGGALSAIEARNRFDLELYRFAVEMLDKALGRIDVETELSLLRSAPIHDGATVEERSVPHLAAADGRM